MAEIYNNKSNTLLSGTSYYDVICNGGYWSGSTRQYGGSKVTINGGSGDDYIENFSGSENSINGGVGSDSIINAGDMTTITGGSGNDSIENGFYPSSGTYKPTPHYAYNATISGGAGDDSIINHLGRLNIKMNGDSGNDLIKNLCYAVTMSGGDDNDTIYNGSDGDNSSISGGTGNDSIQNHGSKVTIICGKGDDTVLNGCWHQYDGTLTFYDDSLYASNVLFKYSKGDGNDVIYGFKSDSTLSIGGGSYSTTKNGNNIIVTVGTGKITLVSAASLDNINIKGTLGGGNIGETVNNTISNKTLNGTNYNDSITNYASNVKIYAGNGNDTVWSTNGYRSNVTINGGDGADRLELWGIKSLITGGSGNDTVFVHGKNVTVNSGNGNDYVENWDDNIGRSDDGDGKTSISTGVGNDTVKNFGSGSTINTGAGNDVIIFSAHIRDEKIYTSSRNLIQYKFGDGNDIIYGINSDSTVQIATNSGYTTQKSGNDLIIKVGIGKMTLKDGADKSFKISTVSGDNSDTKADTKKTQQDVIKAFMHSLDETSLSGTKALDEAVKYASGGKFKTYKKLIENFVTDCRNATNVDKFLKEKCNIDLSNSDTGAITGWDAGGIAIKTAESIVEEKGNLQSYKSSFTLPHEKSGLSLVWKAPKKVTAAQKKIVQGLYSWWFKGALDIITESYGITFEKATVKNITLDFNDLENEDTKKYMREHPNWKPLNYLAYVRGHSSDEKKCDKLTLWINMNHFPKVNLNDCKDGRVFFKNEKGKYVSVSEQGHYLDRYLAHELTHALIFSNVNYYGNLSGLVYEGIPELTHGADIRSNDIKNLIENFHSRTQNDVVNSLMKDKEDAYVAGYTLMRYFAKQASNVPEGVHCDSGKTKIILASDYTGTTFSAEEYFSTIKEIDASVLKSKVNLVGNSLANTIKGGRKDDTLLGGAGADKLYGNAGNDILKGGAGNDSLWGGLGNDSLWGDAGKDTFIYESGEGKDIIYGFENNDLLKITGAFSGTYSKSKGEVYFKVGTTSKAITLTDFSASSFNVNGDIYQISGTKLVKK